MTPYVLVNIFLFKAYPIGGTQDLAFSVRPTLENDYMNETRDPELSQLPVLILA